jgi:hypothetical protein
MTDKQIQRAILRCQTGIRKQELEFDGEIFVLDFSGVWKVYRSYRWERHAQQTMWEFDEKPSPQSLRDFMGSVLDDEKTEELMDG